jgi:RHS repeat-associated protein
MQPGQAGWGLGQASGSGVYQIQSIALQQSGGVPTNRITSVTGASTVNYIYDAAGNVTNDGVHSYTYDAENRVVSVDSGATAQYKYDHQNRRVSKIVSSIWTHYIWQGSQVIGEHDATTAYTANPAYQVNSARLDYIYSGSQMISSRERASSGGSWTTKYYLNDRLSERLVLDATGTVSGRQAHLPFGEDFAESGSQEKRHFTSYERDSEGGSDYAVNRQYSPSVGRFNRADPYHGSYSLTRPQSLNRYSYVQNDPIDNVDALGLFGNCPLGFHAENGPFGGSCKPDNGSTSVNGSRGDDIQIVDEGEEDPGASSKTWQIDLKVLNDCTERLFGITVTSFTPSSNGAGGVFVGFGPDKGVGGNNTVITIRNDNSTYSMSQLKAIENAARAASGRPPLGPDDQVWGETLENAPYTNYTANDLTNALDALKNQIHELGHSLSIVTQINRNPPVGEQGDKLVKCMNQNKGWVLK